MKPALPSFGFIDCPLCMPYYNHKAAVRTILSFAFHPEKHRRDILRKLYVCKARIDTATRGSDWGRDYKYWYWRAQVQQEILDAINDATEWP